MTNLTLFEMEMQYLRERSPYTFEGLTREDLIPNQRSASLASRLRIALRNQLPRWQARQTESHPAIALGHK